MQGELSFIPRLGHFGLAADDRSCDAFYPEPPLSRGSSVDQCSVPIDRKNVDCCEVSNYVLFARHASRITDHEVGLSARRATSTLPADRQLHTQPRLPCSSQRPGVSQQIIRRRPVLELHRWRDGLLPILQLDITPSDSHGDRFRLLGSERPLDTYSRSGTPSGRAGRAFWR
jgi:hypothetical protein